MTDVPSGHGKTAGPVLRLIAHDVCLRRLVGAAGPVQATVECERGPSTKNVEECAGCPRFARIEVHEAGYSLMCQSGEAEVMLEPAREPEPYE